MPSNIAATPPARTASARPVPTGPELHLLQPHLVDQMIVGRYLDDAVELGPVGAYEADTVEGDIVYRPLRADQVEPVINGELVLPANGDLGADRGVLTIYRLTEVLHSLPGVVLDLAEVQVFQDPLEEAVNSSRSWAVRAVQCLP